MQSLHRGSFCACRDGEKPRQESRCKPAEKLVEGRDNPSKCSAESLELLALSAHRLSQGTLGYISEDSLGQRKKALDFTYRRIFG